MKAMNKLMLVMMVSLAIAFFWDSVAFIKNGVHAALDPVFYPILNANLELGMLLFVALITLIITIVQKYTMDHEQLREIKARQKAAQAEIKKYRHDPQKMMEMQKQHMANFGEDMKKSLEITMKPMIYTAVPIILFFRWFTDYFTAMGNPLIFGFMSWIVFYIIASLVLSMILRKIFKIG